MKLTDKEIIQKIEINLYDSITSIIPEKIMKYDSNELGITSHHVEAIQMLYQECAESLLYKILKVDWYQMAEDEFNYYQYKKFSPYTEMDHIIARNILNHIKCVGHTYIDEDRQTIELKNKNGELLNLSYLDKCDFNFIIDQLREFKG